MINQRWVVIGIWLKTRGLCILITRHAGLKIYFTGPSDKMSDDFESDICVMMSDDLQASVQFGSEINLNDAN
jgi:hypothetical protein